MHALKGLLIIITFCLARTIEVTCWIAIRSSSEHKKLLVAFSEIKVWGKTIEIEPKKFYFERKTLELLVSKVLLRFLGPLVCPPTFPVALSHT